MKPFVIVLVSVLLSCDAAPSRRSCVVHEREAFEQCMAKSSSRANECIIFSAQIFDHCAREHACRDAALEPETEVAEREP